MNEYSSDFFKDIKNGSTNSAIQVIPIVLEYIYPKSVLDVGCGGGDWLSIFKQYGVEDIIGIDGDYVNTDDLSIDPNLFYPHDLTTPLRLNKKFDLVVSLEVAEHLPIDKAFIFIENLVQHGDIILFSAAVPGQGGTFHLNEQWPDFWVKVFESFDYIPIDCLRDNIWNLQKVEWWYKQNILFFVKNDKLNSFPSLNKFSYIQPKPLIRIHPALLYNKRIYRDIIYPETVLSLFYNIIKSEFKYFWNATPLRNIKRF